MPRAAPRHGRSGAAGAAPLESEGNRTPFPSAKLTLVKMAADLHGWFPLAILTRQVLVIAF